MDATYTVTQGIRQITVRISGEVSTFYQDGLFEGRSTYRDGKLGSCGVRLGNPYRNETETIYAKLEAEIVRLGG